VTLPAALPIDPVQRFSVSASARLAARSALLVVRRARSVRR